MNSWQRTLICRNFGDLVATTRCNTGLLSRLVQSGVFGLSDLDHLSRLSLSENEKSMQLYKLVQTKSNSFRHLIQALHDDNQTQPHDTLTFPGKSWNDLPDFIQEALLQTMVSFQGDQIPLHDILDGEFSRICDKVGNIKQLLFCDDTVMEVVRNTIPADPTYYVERSIITTREVSRKIFKANSKDIFLIQDSDLDDLHEVAGGEQCETSSNYLESTDSTARFILLEEEADLDDILKSSKNSVHYMKYNDGKFFWCQTSGSVTLIQKHLSKHLKKLEEAEFLRECLTSRSPVCVFDTPGMGKSVLLARLANQTRNQYPRRLIIFLALHDLVQLLKSNQKIDKDSICDAIASKVSRSEFGQNVVKLALTSGDHHCELFLDGFDEVTMDLRPLANDVLKTLQKLKGARLYVTTRPHMKTELERTLSSLGYRMKSFQEEDQVRFLVSYWTAECATKNYRLTEYAKKCLEALKDNMMSDSERDIAGIPLQCLLLAKVHLEGAKRYSRRLREGTGPLVKITSMFEMYKLHMEKSFATYDLDPFPTPEECEALAKEERFRKLISWDPPLVDEMLFMQMYQAIVLLFPETRECFQTLLLRNKPDTSPQMFKAGILEATGGSQEFEMGFRFVHRTFAEFLVALYFTNCIWLNTLWRGEEVLFERVFKTIKQVNPILTSHGFGNEDMEETSLPHFVFQLPVVCFFINAIIRERGMSSMRLTSLEVLISEAFQPLVTAAVCGRLGHLATLFSEAVKRRTQYRTPLPSPHTLLLLATKHGDLEDVKFCIELLATLKKTNVDELNSYVQCYTPKFTVTPFHVAIQEGKHEVFTFLLKTHPNLFKRAEYLLQTVVYGSTSDTDYILEEKIKIIKLLSKHLPHLLHEEVKENKSGPLLQPSIHPKLFRVLIELGAKSDFTNAAGETILHIAAKTGNLEAVQYLIQSKPEYISKTDLELNTAIHSAVLTVTLDTIQLELIRAGASVTQRNKAVQTPFQYAMVSGKGLRVEVIQAMVTQGLQLTPEVASDALKALLVNKAVSLNEWDEAMGETVAHLVSHGGALRFKDVDSPWNLHQIESNMEKLVEATWVSAKLLEALKKYVCNPEMIQNTRKSDKLYEILKGMPGSFEALLISLISTGQKTSFQILKFCLQAEHAETEFVTLNPSVVDFLSDEDTKSMILYSRNFELTLSRLQDIDFNIDEVTEDQLKTMRDCAGTSVILALPWLTPVVPESILQHKFIFVCPSSEGDTEQEPLDDFKWTDFSTRFKNEVVTFVQQKLSCDSAENASAVLEQLPSRHLLEIVTELKSEGASQNKPLPLQLSPRDVLRDAVFDNFVSDILVFEGLTLDQLTPMARCGQKVDVSSGQLEKVSAHFILLENVSHFAPICAKASETVHLVNCTNDKMYIKQTHGSFGNISPYLEGGLSRPLDDNFLNDCNGQIQLFQIPNDSYVGMLESLITAICHNSIVLKLDYDKLQNSDFVTVINEVCAWGPFLELQLGKCVLILNLCDVHFKTKFDQLVETVLSATMKLPSLKILVTSFCVSQLELAFSSWRGFEMSMLQTSHFVDHIVNSCSNSNDTFRQQAEQCLDVFEDCFGVPTLSDNFAEILGAEDVADYVDDCTPSVQFYCEVVTSYLKSQGHRHIITLTPRTIFKMMRFHCLRERKIFENKEILKLLTSAVTNFEFSQKPVRKHHPNGIYEILCYHLSERIASGLFDMSSGNPAIREKISELIAAGMCATTEITTTSMITLHVFQHPIFILFLHNAIRIHGSEHLDKFLRSQPKEFLGLNFVQATMLVGSVNLFRAVVQTIVSNGERLTIDSQLLGVAVAFSNFQIIQDLFNEGPANDYSRFDKMRVSIGDTEFSLLTIAVFRGDLHIVEYLLEKKLRFLGNFWLHLAVQNSLNDHPSFMTDKLKILETVIKLNDEVLQERDNIGRTPLHMPDIHHEIIGLLLKLGADLSVENNQGQTPLHMMASYLNSTDFSSLLAALQRDHRVMTEKALKSEDFEGCTVLHRAFRASSLPLEAIEIFASLGANLNAACSQGRSILNVAVTSFQSVTTLAALVKHGADFKETADDGRSLLHVAAQCGSINAIQYLISLGVNIRDSDSEGDTPLHYVFFGDPNSNLVETVRCLVVLGAEVNERGDSGRVPLHYAVLSGMSRSTKQAIQFLLDKGADASIVDSEGRTFLHHASDGLNPGEYETLLFFLDKSYPAILKQVCQAKNDQQCIPLHDAARDLELGKDGLSLFAKYCDVNSVDKYGNPVLFYAIQGGRTQKFLEVMVELGANWEVKNDGQAGVLHCAAECGNVEALKYFVDRGGDTNAVDVNNRTPMHIAVMTTGENCHEMVNLLLSEGANIMLKDNEGKTVLDLAQEGKGNVNKETLELLRAWVPKPLDK